MFVDVPITCNPIDSKIRQIKSWGKNKKRKIMNYFGGNNER